MGDNFMVYCTKYPLPTKGSIIYINYLLLFFHDFISFRFGIDKILNDLSRKTFIYITKGLK